MAESREPRGREPSSLGTSVQSRLSSDDDSARASPEGLATGQHRGSGGGLDPHGVDEPPYTDFDAAAFTPQPGLHARRPTPSLPGDVRRPSRGDAGRDGRTLAEVFRHRRSFGKNPY